MKRLHMPKRWLLVALSALALSACASNARSSTAVAAPHQLAVAGRDSAVISGRITSGEGKPVPYPVIFVDYKGANIAVRGDADGRYRVEGAPTGHHDVFAYADGYSYDHGGFPDLRPGVNQHSRTLVRVNNVPQEPTVSDLKWSDSTVKPGASVDVTGTWKSNDGSGISDELFVFVPEFRHPGIFGLGLLHSGKNPDGRYMATLKVPPDARPGKYTAYVIGAEESCYVNYNWPTHEIIVRP